MTAAVATDELRYPIGRYEWPTSPVDADRREAWLSEIAAAPAGLRAAAAGLDEARLDTRYRAEGWTVRQVVHHVPDSHMQAYLRFKLALTEEEPVVKPYAEAAWAELPDRVGSIDASLALLDALHERWVLLMRGMSAADWSRAYFHPEQGRALRLDAVAGMYAWHGKHHTAHVSSLREREGWR